MTESGPSLRRVMVIGSPGAGKTELGTLLADRLGLPFVDLDDEHWGAGWTEPPDDVWRERMVGLVAPDGWLLAGNYGGTIDLRAARADLVVLLDLPPLLCVWRLILRMLKTRLRRQVWRLPRDCRAGPDWEPLREFPAFLCYTWRFRRDGLPRALAELRRQGVERVVRLRSGAQVRRLTRALDGDGHPSTVLAGALTALTAR